MLEAEITAEGDVLVEGHRVGQLQGFRFAPDPSAEGTDAKAVRNAASKSLASEIDARAEKFSKAQNSEIILSSDGTLRWLGEVIAKLTPSEDTLRPNYVVLADEQLTGPSKEKVDQRLTLWIKAHVETLLKPLTDLRDTTELEGMARGIAFQLVEALGVLERSQIAEEVKGLDQPMRASLRKFGVRFGAYHIFLPALLKPAPSGLIAELWSLKNPGTDSSTSAALHQLSASGRTSIPVDKSIPKALYKVVGFRVCGERAVRIDILERLADIIRPLISWKPLDASVSPPEGAIPTGGGFTVTVAMTSLCGCSGEDFAGILKSLGYRVEKRKVERPVRAVKAATATPAVETAILENAEELAAHIIADQGEPAGATEETIILDAPAEAAFVPEIVAEGPAPDLGPDVTPGLAVEPAPGAEIAVTETESEPADALPESEADLEPVVQLEATATESLPEPAVEMETIEIDVWRPGRFERGGDHHHHRRGGRHEGGDRPEGAARPQRQPRVTYFPNARKPAEAQPDQMPAEGQAAPAEGATAEQPRHENRDNRPRGDFNRNRPNGGRDRDRGQGNGDREANRGPRPDRGDRRPDAHQSRPNDKPQRVEKAIDPDSPFAKLMALKADLEAKQKGDKK